MNRKPEYPFLQASWYPNGSVRQSVRLWLGANGLWTLERLQFSPFEGDRIKVAKSRAAYTSRTEATERFKQFGRKAAFWKIVP